MRTGWTFEGRRRAIAAWWSLAMSLPALAADQVWLDTNADNRWSTAVANWDAGVVWVNGNNAIFGGTGEAVDTEGAISAVNLTFNVTGYSVADATADGTLTLAGTPSILTVTTAGDTATISEILAGAGGLRKSGAGTLVISGVNTFAGQAVADNGTLRLSAANPSALGASGAGNETIVTNGATLDFAGAYSGGNVSEDLIISGHGVGGLGALVNTGAGQVNVGFRNLTLMDDATIGGGGRIDLGGAGTFTGNGRTLYKAGAMEMAVSRAVNGSPIVINAGTFTIQNASALGGVTAGDTTVNGSGRLQAYGNYTLAETVVFNGGFLAQGNLNTTVNMSGHLTFNSPATVNSSADRWVVLSGVVDGAGGLTNTGGGRLVLASDTVTYQGVTVNAAGSYLYVGQNGGVSGRPGTNIIVNSGVLLFDRSNAYTLSNQFYGAGVADIRYGGAVTLDAAIATTNTWRLSNGTLSLPNGAVFAATTQMIIADKLSSYYSVDPVAVTATVNIANGGSMTVAAFEVGNGTNITAGSMLGIFNQSGGTVRTTGTTAEGNGIRLGHYPQAFGTYNMMGGTLIIDNGYDLGIATDGTGWVHQTGGEIQTARVMLNERTGAGGYGRLTVEGGVLLVGSGGITRDPSAPYLVEYGGSGGVIRASAAFSSDLNATLSGAGTNAISLDTAGFDVAVSGALSGAGGLTKTGAGRLTLSGANTYTGPTAVSNGTLFVGTGGALASSTSFWVAAGATLDVTNLPSAMLAVGGGRTISGNGTVVGSVSLASGATLAAGSSAGTLTIVNGGLTLQPGSTFAVEVDGANADQTVVSGAVDLGGATLNVTQLSGAPTAPSYLILTASSVTGRFAGFYEADQVMIGAVPYYIHYRPTYVELNLTPTAVVLFQFGAVAEGTDVVLRWRTASEISTAGFDVYRKAGDSWVKVNDALIAATGAPQGGIGASYALVDAGAAAGGTYEYKLVEHTADGGAAEYGPYERTATAFEMTSPIRPTAQGMEIRWLSREGEMYRVLRSTNLAGWSPLTIGGGLAATPPENVFVDTNAAPLRVYRVEMEQ